MNGAPLVRTPPRRSWAAGRHPRGGGDYRPVGRRVFYCERCSADRAPTGRVPGLIGALSSSSQYAVLLCWYWGPTYSGIVRLCFRSRLDSVAFLTYLLTTGTGLHRSCKTGTTKSERTAAVCLCQHMEGYHALHAESSTVQRTRHWARGLVRRALLFRSPQPRRRPEQPALDFILEVRLISCLLISLLLISCVLGRREDVP